MTSILSLARINWSLNSKRSKFPRKRREVSIYFGEGVLLMILG